MRLAIYSACLLLTIGDGLFTARWVADRKESLRVAASLHESATNADEIAAWESVLKFMPSYFTDWAEKHEHFQKYGYGTTYVRVKAFQFGDVQWLSPRKIRISGTVYAENSGGKTGWRSWATTADKMDQGYWIHEEPQFGGMAGEPKFERPLPVD